MSHNAKCPANGQGEKAAPAFVPAPLNINCVITSNGVVVGSKCSINPVAGPYFWVKQRAGRRARHKNEEEEEEEDYGPVEE